jgi:putative selenate reductase
MHSYHTGEVRLAYRDVEVRPDGSVMPIGPEREFALTQSEQIANFADYCNHCGNCDTFCPEYDGPYLKKPNFFGSRRAFDAGAPHDGFLLEGERGQLSLTGRIQSGIYRLAELPGGGRRYDDCNVSLFLGSKGAVRLASSPPASSLQVDMGRVHMLLTLMRGISDPARIHAINTRLLAPAEVD